MELLSDGTELHLASLRFVDASLTLQSTDHPAFAALKTEFADVLGGPPRGLPPDRGIELVLETGDRPMPRTRSIKRLLEGGLAELRRQLLDLLDRGWMIAWNQPSTAGLAASVVFARKSDGSWRICYDYRGLNAITEPLVEPLPHIDALLDETRGAQWFTKFDLAQGYHQVRIREADWWKTSFRSQLGQFEWRVMPFGVQGASSVLMRVMNSAMTRGLRQPDLASQSPDAAAPTGVPGATGPLHRSVVVYMDDLLCFSPTLEQHLQDVREVLAILRQEKLFVKASKCEFGRTELGFLGHRVSAAGVAVDPRKVSAVRDWPTPTSNVDLRRFVGLCNYYRPASWMDMQTSQHH